MADDPLNHPGLRDNRRLVGRRKTHRLVDRNIMTQLGALITTVVFIAACIAFVWVST